MTTRFTPTVTVALEEWDNTTDVIVWLIEQKQEYHINVSELSLEKTPEHQRGRIYDFMESQSADLTGWMGEQKVRLTFDAEYKDDLVNPETEETVEGYEVTVSRRFLNDYKSKNTKFATYQVSGSDRDEFEIIGEKLEA